MPADTTVTLTSNEFTFGIEIECYIPTEAIQANEVRIGEYHGGIQIPGFPEGWVAMSDGSITSYAPSGKVGIEIVSGVLRGTAGIQQVIAVTSKLREWGASVNARCGLHVHVGWPLNPGQPSVSRLSDLCHIVANHEKALFASTGTHSREQNNYCQPIKDRFKNLNFDARSYAAFVQNNSYAEQKYHGMNLKNVFSGGSKRTVEFRAFAGTVNTQKIIAHVRMAVAFVEKALKIKRRPMWDAKETSPTSPIARGGAGQTEMNRFFYAMGWTKGRVVDTYGAVGLDVMPIEKSKEINMKMAAKYDGPQAPANELQPAASDADTN